MAHSDETNSASECALSSPDPKRRKVSHATYLTWKCDLDRSELAGSRNACKFTEKARNKATVQRLHEIQYAPKKPSRCRLMKRNGTGRSIPV